MHPLLQACAIVAGVVAFSFSLALLVARWWPQPQDDDAICNALRNGGVKLRNLRNHVDGSDTGSEVQHHGA